MTLASVCSLLSRVGKENPELAADEKVRRYTLLIVEEARKLPVDRGAIAPVDVSEVQANREEGRTDISG